MNTARVMEMLTDKDEATGAYKIPHFIYSDAYVSETVAYADLVLPDTTYLERWDCISLLDRPICDADGPADAIRQPIVPPDRDVRAFQTVLLDLGARLGLPRHGRRDGSPQISRRLPDYIVNHERAPGIGPLAGWRGANGESLRARRRQSQAARSLYRQRLLLASRTRAGSANSTSSPTRAISNSPPSMGFVAAADADRHPALFASRCKNSVSRRKARRRSSRPSDLRARRQSGVRSAADLVSAATRRRWSTLGLPAARADPAADDHVSFLGLAERLAAPDPRPQPALCQRRARRASSASPTTTGCASSQPQRRDQGADPDDGGRQRRHGLDLERDRQARGRLEPRARRARGAQGIPAQSSDQRACCPRRTVADCRIPIR